MLCLSDREVRDLTSLIALLSAPLHFSDSTSWRREVMRRGRKLLDAASAVFTLEWDGTNPIEDQGVDPAAVPAYRNHYHALDLGHTERRRHGRTVFGYCQLLAEGWEIFPEFRHDFLERYRLDRAVVMARDVTPNVAGWCNFYPGSEPRDLFESRALPILEVTYPAFRAGVDTLFRTRGLRDDLTRLLDTVSDGFLFLGSDGRIVHQNRALGRIRDADPEWKRLAQVLETLWSRFRTATKSLEQTTDLFRAVLVTTERASYEVIPTLPGPDLTHLGVRLLVQVVPRTAILPSCQTLAERFGLTVRESEVTRCLARGMAYKNVAEHLDISIDTVRSHIRNIYEKLRVHSVTEAVSLLLRDRV